MNKFLLSGLLVLGSAAYVFVIRSQEAVPQLALATDAIAIATSSDAVPARTSTTSALLATPKQTPTPVRTPTPTPTPVPVPQPAQGAYRNGTYTGSVADAYYGTVQVAAVISDGKLANVKILQYPNDREQSVEINQRALPRLIREAIAAQSANIDGVSGASDTSPAFIDSLRTALASAKA